MSDHVTKITTYKFEDAQSIIYRPKEDITAYELALLTPILADNKAPITYPFKSDGATAVDSSLGKYIAALPPAAQRHFETR